MKSVVLFGVYVLVPAVLGACSRFRVRKEVNDLSSDEWQRLIEAFNKLHYQRVSTERLQNNTFTSLGQFVSSRTNVSMFEQLANLHSGRRTEIHKYATVLFSMNRHGSVAVFLGWHRWHLYQLETALQEIDETVTLPYWAWSYDASSPQRSIVWDKFGSSVASSSLSPLSAPCVPSGAFKNWRVRGDCIRRWFNASDGTSPAGAILPYSCLQKILRNATKFSDFGESIVVPHNWFHLWIGGSMATLEEAANDPVFYIHHAYVDKLYSTWQRMSTGREEEYNSNDTNEIVSVMDSLPGFANVSVRDTLKNSDLCVTYQEPIKTKPQSEAAWKWPNEAAMKAVMTWMEMDMESFTNRQQEIRQLCNIPRRT